MFKIERNHRELHLKDGMYKSKITQPLVQILVPSGIWRHRLNVYALLPGLTLKLFGSLDSQSMVMVFYKF